MDSRTLGVQNVPELRERDPRKEDFRAWIAPGKARVCCLKTTSSRVFGSKADEINQIEEVKACEAMGARDLAVVGRNRSILKGIIRPQRCKLEELSAIIESWDSSVLKYEKRKEQKGEQLKLTGHLRMTAFESTLPFELENHLVPTSQKW